MSEHTVVYLSHDGEGHPYVVVTDYPNAETTIGAQKMLWFDSVESGWPQDAVAYAEELRRQNGSCLINYEPWSMRDLGEEEDEFDDE